MAVNVRISHIEIEDISIEVVKKKIKNMYLSVRPPNGSVRISAPFKANNETIRLFISSKIPWIKKQQLKFQQKKPPPQIQPEYISGENHYLWGAAYLLNVVYSEARSKVELRNNQYIDLYIKAGSTKEERRIILTKWYRKELKAQISQLVEKWQEIIGVCLNCWAVKNMKTKWGTCNISARRIWLNLQLVKMPLRCLEYVVVHEIIHLLARYHDKRFDALMDNYLPKWRSVKEELNSGNYL